MEKRAENLKEGDISFEMSQFSIFYKKTCVFQKDFLKTPLRGWTWLHGGNGSGKSTLIRAMLGLLPQTKGRVEIMGQKPSKIRSKIGYMPQKREENGLFLPVLSHVETAIGVGVGFFPSAQRLEKAKFLLEECGISALADRPLKPLSGGERQKVALAQALACDPLLLILDEPFIALDPKGQREIMTLLLSMERKRRMGILLATHEAIDLLPQKRQDLYLREGTLFDVP